MKSDTLFHTRRALLGAALALAMMPRAGLSQPQINATAGGTAMRIRCAFGAQNFTATLLANPSARDFASMLPLDLTLEDYSTNEKIAYLPRKLTEDGSGPFSGEQPRGPLLLRALGQSRVLPRRLSLLEWLDPARTPE